MAELHFDVTTLGEMLVRMSVRSGERLENAKSFDIHPAGTESIWGYGHDE
jgi:hypothetical protein